MFISHIPPRIRWPGFFTLPPAPQKHLKPCERYPKRANSQNLFSCQMTHVPPSPRNSTNPQKWPLFCPSSAQKNIWKALIFFFFPRHILEGLFPIPIHLPSHQCSLICPTLSHSALPGALCCTAPCHTGLAPWSAGKCHSTAHKTSGTGLGVSCEHASLKLEVTWSSF